MVTSSRLLLIASMALAFLAIGCERLECANDEDCPEHWACVGSSVCPDDVVCIWEGEPGICLPDKDPALCKHSGGEWDDTSCGHYTCGDFPECDAVIPGCDCGPDANWMENRGCVEDIECTGGCYSDEDCEEGLECHGARQWPPPHPRPHDLLSYDLRMASDMTTASGMKSDGPMCMWDHNRPGECVAPSDALCEETGGEWLEEPCKHSRCGWGPVDGSVDPRMSARPEICEMDLAPICNCGEGRRFVPSDGCVDEPRCPTSCAGDEECDEGQMCVPTLDHGGMCVPIRPVPLPMPYEVPGDV